MSNAETKEDAPRDMRRSLKRGLRCKCPNCGIGSVFKGYLKVRTECEACGLDLTPQRADDGPAYVVILLVGHFVGFALPVFFESFRDNPLLVACLLSVVSIVMALALLPPVKGMFVAFQWAKRMHGFGAPRTPADVSP
ncbi:DUF983 domain-containing protein [Phaeobacter sp. HF9A]|uniref:DUF983 domain-containing protein n=1 Tax=Phaeobacter sp. HF9A TaxID=2721561 RepID=UPI00142F81A1|nr:DUF983 domain-containing protein [Phaeobacter sp. HF9A]NIZ12328.1 DUF983 domain-containing protein [Phaeobacter sp. HF9A]